jgi:hypothetical protein
VAPVEAGAGVSGEPRPLVRGEPLLLVEGPLSPDLAPPPSGRG